MDTKSLNKLKRMKKAELVDEIVRLSDENESLWGMLEELKASDTKNYKTQFQGMVNKKIRELQHIAGSVRNPLKAFSVGKKK